MTVVVCSVGALEGSNSVTKCLDGAASFLEEEEEESLLGLMGLEEEGFEGIEKESFMASLVLFDSGTEEGEEKGENENWIGIRGGLGFCVRRSQCLKSHVRPVSMAVDGIGN